MHVHKVMLQFFVSGEMHSNFPIQSGQAASGPAVHGRHGRPAADFER